MSPLGPVLLLHGWQGSGPGHWQSWFAERTPEAHLPSLPDPDRPRLEPWLAALEMELAAFAEPPTVVCHSLGSVLWMHHVTRRRPGAPVAARVLLVAPPCACPPLEALAEFLPAPREPLAIAAASLGETRLVCSETDPYCPEGARHAYAELGLPVDLMPGEGHINTDAGYGPWPELEAWVRGETATLAPRAHAA